MLKVKKMAASERRAQRTEKCRVAKQVLKYRRLHSKSSDQIMIRRLGFKIKTTLNRMRIRCTFFLIYVHCTIGSRDSERVCEQDYQAPSKRSSKLCRQASLLLSHKHFLACIA